MLADLDDHVREEGFGEVDQGEHVREWAVARGVAGGWDGDVAVQQDPAVAQDETPAGEAAWVTLEVIALCAKATRYASACWAWS